jgi:hypothetical protein
LVRRLQNVEVEVELEFLVRVYLRLAALPSWAGRKLRYADLDVQLRVTVQVVLGRSA